ncbi:MAG: D-aminoacyl-tRNA deacylase [Gammaproteobacteria bacterium]|nr:D-aminoacyl-tRNA deacylase [Gammaproteobacteria bacterium]
MRVLLQRVASASVEVNGAAVAAMDKGLLLFAGFGGSDNASVLAPMADKILDLRVFEDERGRFQYSVVDTRGDLLVVPQFTLYGDTRRGRRPDFSGAIEPVLAEALFAEFVDVLAARAAGRVECGRFGAHMTVQLVNDGPVTLLLERDSRQAGRQS